MISLLVCLILTIVFLLVSYIITRDISFSLFGGIPVFFFSILVSFLIGVVACGDPVQIDDYDVSVAGKELYYVKDNSVKVLDESYIVKTEDVDKIKFRIEHFDTKFFLIPARQVLVIPEKSFSN